MNEGLTQVAKLSSKGRSTDIVIWQHTVFSPKYQDKCLRIGTINTRAFLPVHASWWLSLEDSPSAIGL